jgi:hypothetical protein
VPSEADADVFLVYLGGLLPAANDGSCVLGMGQAMDTWLMTQQPDHDDLPRLIGGS